MSFSFEAISRREITISEATANLAPSDLAQLTNELYDEVNRLIAEANDADVVFTPVDPEANDTYASDDSVKDLAWTLGHVIVHITASAEESAFLAAELARGIPNSGRSRYETEWTTVTTIGECRARLAESRRMCLASLGMWPDAPHYEIIVTTWPGGPQVDARGRYIVGLWHLHSHLGQLGEIMRQAKG